LHGLQSELNDRAGLWMVQAAAAAADNTATGEVHRGEARSWHSISTKAMRLNRNSVLFSLCEGVTAEQLEGAVACRANPPRGPNTQQK
jgi:hypothetical protein